MLKRELPKYLVPILFAVLLAPCWRSASAQDETLIPRLGETKAEFEARSRGLIRPTQPDPTLVTIPADPQGHFYVEPAINGTRLRMMVDTGASLVFLSRQDAHRAGINPTSADFMMRAATANGIVMVASTILKEITIEDVVVHNVPAAVLPDDKLQMGLLGMSFLSKLSHFEVARGRLVLKK
jgi:aspartyl protease family protein